MRNLRFFVVLALVMVVALLGTTALMPHTILAQDTDVGTPPFIITPGASLRGQVGTPSATEAPFDFCFTPFPLVPGDLIYIEPGTNIRSAPDYSSPIVWNTSFNQVDDNGNPLRDEELFNVEASVVAGPVCMNGYNWWQVNLTSGNDGWVSEGRPTDPGGYLLRTPGIDFDIDCVPIFDLVPGETATVTQHVRVREAPDTNARVKTVAPSGSEILILSGPECNARAGLVWFEVQVTVLDFVYRGWMTQGAGGAVWLIPTDLPSEEAGTLCGAPENFEIGSLGYVNSFERRSRYLRSAPGLDTSVKYLLIDGVPFEFIGGPVCADNLNWWNIRVRSSNPVDGWIAEGASGAQWLSPIDPDEYER